MILGAKYPLVNDFVSFLQQVQPVKVINKDQWHNFYDFVTSISPDLDDYDEMSACKFSAHAIISCVSVDKY